MYLTNSPVTDHPKDGQVLFIEDGDENFPGEILKLAPRIVDPEGDHLHFVVFYNQPENVYEMTKSALKTSLRDLLTRKALH